MRWSRLFDDLEAQLAMEERETLRSEVAEHVRAERARLSLVDRLVTGLEAPVSLTVRGSGVLEGRLREVGADWCVLHTGVLGPQRRRDVLVPLAAVLAVTGLPLRADQREGSAQRRLTLRHALRALSRDRAAVRLTDVEGAHLTGTIDRVGLDHLDLADHADDEPRRPRAVRSWQSVPFAALGCVRQL